MIVSSLLWLYSKAFVQTVFAPRHLASLWKDRWGWGQRGCTHSSNSKKTASNLVMSASVTTLPALTAALKQSAPTVSMAMMGTSVQPTSFRPWMTPQRRPPPPTDTSTAPGLTPGPRESATSVIILAWPCLGVCCEKDDTGDTVSHLILQSTSFVEVH